jgi:riboflavin synthase
VIVFTGIVEELGSIRTIERHAGGARLVIDARVVLADAEIGASIAVNGVCLTVVDLDGDAGWWAADAVIETMQRTNLGDLAPGDPVNLERPVRLADRLGGHIVQGHVDGTGTIVGKDTNADGSVTLRIFAPGEVLRFAIEKGSITVDGISLTVVEVSDDSFTIAVIPHTQHATTLGPKPVGARVNLESDVIAKYVDRLVQPVRSTPSVTHGRN